MPKTQTKTNQNHPKQTKTVVVNHIKQTKINQKQTNLSAVAGKQTKYKQKQTPPERTRSVRAGKKQVNPNKNLPVPLSNLLFSRL